MENEKKFNGGLKKIRLDIPQLNWNDFFVIDHANGVATWKERTDVMNPGNINRKNKGKVAGWKKKTKQGCSYLAVMLKGYQIPVQYVIWESLNGSVPEGMVLDHINHDGCDNRIANLRIVSRDENNRNFSLSKRNKSGRVGVSWNSDYQKWKACITHNGNYHFLGNFEDINDAIQAREIAEKKFCFHRNHGKQKPKSFKEIA